MERDRRGSKVHGQLRCGQWTNTLRAVDREAATSGWQSFSGLPACDWNRVGVGLAKHRCRDGQAMDGSIDEERCVCCDIRWSTLSSRISSDKCDIMWSMPSPEISSDRYSPRRLASMAREADVTRGADVALVIG
ncbi:hypothetical protein BHM03_00045076 [Ensete ventricosum]|nr:hypothetical protein BHM03_00045076 [Ensete ventricosum]